MVYGRSIRKEENLCSMVAALGRWKKIDKCYKVKENV